MPIPKTVTINHKLYKLHSGGYDQNDAKKYAKYINDEGRYKAEPLQRGVIGFEKVWAIYVRKTR